MVRATYILRYIYSLKSYVVNLQRKWVLANQSCGRRFSTWKKKEQKNKNKNKQKTIRPIRIAYDYFLGVSEMMRLIRSQRCVSFALKFPPFIGACGLQRLCLEVTSQIFKEKRFSPRALLLGKGEAYRKLEWVVSYISLSMNSGKGKNRMRRKLKLYILIGVTLFSV